MILIVYIVVSYISRQQLLLYGRNLDLPQCRSMENLRKESSFSKKEAKSLMDAKEELKPELTNSLRSQELFGFPFWLSEDLFKFDDKFSALTNVINIGYFRLKIDGRSVTTTPISVIAIMKGKEYRLPYEKKEPISESSEGIESLILKPFEQPDPIVWPAGSWLDVESLSMDHEPISLDDATRKLNQQSCLIISHHNIMGLSWVAYLIILVIFGPIGTWLIFSSWEGLLRIGNRGFDI